MPIQTGQTFVLQAAKPDDLPSWELLEMQWNLLRVAAICGAADVTDDYHDSDDSDNEDCGQARTTSKMIVLEDVHSKGKEVDCWDTQAKAEQDKAEDKASDDGSKDNGRPGGEAGR